MYLSSSSLAYDVFMKRKNLLIASLIILSIGLLAGSYFFKPAGFRIIFFAVGQGDSSLIITPRGQTILIDGGPDDQVLRELGRALPFGSEI